MGFVGFFFSLTVRCFDLLAWPLLALGYPLRASIMAIETNSDLETRKLVTYWIVFSLISLFEHAFVKLFEWIPLWLYIKLMIVCWLVIPHFDGSYYVYMHVVRPFLSMDTQTVIKQLKKLKEISFERMGFSLKRDNFIDEVEKFVKENGPEALEELIASKSKLKENVVKQKDIKAVEATEDKKVDVAQQSKLKDVVKQKDIKAVEPTEVKKADVAQQSKLKDVVKQKYIKAVEATEDKKADVAQQSKLKDVVKQKYIKAVEATEDKKADVAQQVFQTKVKSAEADISTHSPVEVKELPSATSIRVEVPVPDNIQKEWTCSICQVTTSSEAILTSHLQGRRHKATLEKLSAKNQNSKMKVPPASEEKKPSVPKVKPEKTVASSPMVHKVQISPNNVKCDGVATRQPGLWCFICNVGCTGMNNMDSHFKGKKHLTRVSELNGVAVGGHS
ncbi:hypothetical protein HS088_TW17G00922 [Tripterygium wilfordii]|uniref:HVA22-like protein n=1 Tax=Tripterygium wilfordii TaxID=458696 RepID=A0A7J7CH70_TRIWF|nr:uncharacterized protein LOC119982351 [Tripterygium wilfordii]KAF5733379.1 hypothetical protein HS088_TW17G00922 [Tripterygium wilfordii]